MMADLAGWIAPIATMIAAMMTAANLGARLTGWGFAVFVIGSLAWVTVGMTSGQTNLVLSNAFLTLVNIVGVWRWLGVRARYEKGERHAEEASAAGGAEALFALGPLGGRKIEAEDGTTIGEVVDAMAESASGAVAYLVVSSGGVGGVGETLHAIAWGEITRVEDERLVASIPIDRLRQRPKLDPACWPATREAAGLE